MDVTQPLSMSALIQAIKNTKFSRRKQASERIQLYHAGLIPPRRVDVENNRCGTTITYICADTDCKVRITVRRFKIKGEGVYWAVCEDKDEQWEHSLLCEKVVSIPMKTAATLLKDVKAKGKELINVMRDRGLNFGGSQAKQCALTHREHVYANRLAVKIEQARNDTGDINLLPGILNEFASKNLGSHVAFEFDESYFKRCVIVSKMSIAMFHANYLRKLFSIDRGFWKHKSGKQYKLLLISASTGNNDNCSVARSIVDGEKRENIVWVLNELKKAGIDLNSPDVATITDEGKAILSAIESENPHGKHMICANHWIGNRIGVWEKKGTNTKTLFWELVYLNLITLL